MNQVRFSRNSSTLPLFGRFQSRSKHCALSRTDLRLSSETKVGDECVYVERSTTLMRTYEETQLDWMYMWDWELEMRLIAESSAPPEYALIRFLLVFVVLSQLCISLIYASPHVYGDYVDRESQSRSAASSSSLRVEKHSRDSSLPTRDQPLQSLSHRHHQSPPVEPHPPPAAPASRRHGRRRGTSRRSVLQNADSDVLYGEHVDRETSRAGGGGAGGGGGAEVRTIVRRYQLYNRCSKREVQIVGQNVFANAKPDSVFANLRVETDTFGSRVRIASARYRNYLCFNRRGRLTVRHSGKSKKCVFRETITEDKFTEFQSVANPLWYIGFRKNGKPLKGYQRTRERKRQCFQFIKTDFPYAEVTDDTGSQWGPDVDFRKIVTHLELWTQSELEKT